MAKPYSFGPKYFSNKGAKNKSLKTAKIMVIKLNKPMVKVPPKVEVSKVKKPLNSTIEVRIMAFPVPNMVSRKASSGKSPFLSSIL